LGICGHGMLEDQGVQLMQVTPWMRPSANIPWPQMPNTRSPAFMPTRA
jgi:hypothetical protein